MRLQGASIVVALLLVETTVAAAGGDDKVWQSVYDARTNFYRDHFGTIPQDILKMLNLIGAWPGGGLCELKADKLKGGWIAATFGLTNPDMPSLIRSVDNQQKGTPQGPSTNGHVLVKKEHPPKPVPGRAGYGYELLVMTDQREGWALDILQWFANAEINEDVGLLDRVGEVGGVTVEDIEVRGGLTVNVLVAPAAPPLPVYLPLPNGRAVLLVATVITEPEMRFAMTSGKDGNRALLKMLLDSPLKQKSTLKRASLVK
jgi:hypothetical protein